jgi:hypothetical protein
MGMRTWLATPWKVWRAKRSEDQVVCRTKYISSCSSPEIHFPPNFTFISPSPKTSGQAHNEICRPVPKSITSPNMSESVLAFPDPLSAHCPPTPVFRKPQFAASRTDLISKGSTLTTTASRLRKMGGLARCGFLPETCYVVICQNHTRKLLMASARHAIAFISPFRSRKSAMQATVMWRLWAWWQVELYQSL